MAFDQSTRNRLARFVSDTRALLTEEFTRQLQHVYGLDPETGDVTDPARLTLDNVQRETARLLRETMEHYLASADTSTAAKAKKARQETLNRIVREQAFTVLNRLCALRMAEARGLLIESIAKGYQSKGFQLYQRLAGTALGETGDCYRVFLFSVFDEFAVDLPVLFDRFSPQGRLFPRETALLAVLDQINHPDIDPLWAEDETIGWIYQYFNSVEERRQMRAESQAPRNSRELAVRNQFFTPRYVVEFLTDNTLGRIWYEATQGQTALKDSCRYLVRRPNEIFLAEGEEAPEQEQSAEDLSQEELLKQPVYIPHRPLKDPRDIKMLDPACGSMHFGLYAFDLFERIYDEAWDLEAERGPDAFVRPEGLKPLRETYDSKEAFLCDVPRLIIERNIHGIDIDPRAVQIAGLSLWLRAQKSWQAQGIKAQDRPQIQRSNIVCAEPMPGEADMLEEFLKGLREDRLESLIRRVLKVPENQKVRATPRMADALCEIVRTVWKEMELAGEAGSLLKIEESLADAIAKGKEEWVEKAPLFRVTEFGLTEEEQANPKVKYYKTVPGEEEEDFWSRAETLVLAALEEYAEHAQPGEAVRRRLFASDAAKGFAFIHLWQNRFDVALMNPPFGEAASQSQPYIDAAYRSSKTDVFGSFVLRALHSLTRGGRVGVITNRTGFFNSQFSQWRIEACLEDGRLATLADLGYGVLDALVETAAYVIAADHHAHSQQSTFFNLLKRKDKEQELLFLSSQCAIGKIQPDISVSHLDVFRLLKGSPFCYWVPERTLRKIATHPHFETEDRTAKQGLATADDFRFIYAAWEVPPQTIHRRTFYLAKGGEYSPYWDDVHLVINWHRDGHEAKAFAGTLYNNSHWSRILKNVDFYLRPGLTYPERTTSDFGPRVLPEGCIFTATGQAIFFSSKDDALAFLGLAASRPFRFLFELFIGSGDAVVSGSAARHYKSGIVNATPVPNIFGQGSDLAAAVARAVALVRDSFSGDETTRYFLCPQVLHTAPNRSLRDRLLEAFHRTLDRHMEVLAISHRIDSLSCDAYGLDHSDLAVIDREFGIHVCNLPHNEVVEWEDLEHKWELNDDQLVDAVAEQRGRSRQITKKSFYADRRIELCAIYYGVHPDLVANEVRRRNLLPPGFERQMSSAVVSYVVGCVFGRWDVRVVFREHRVSEADVFEVLPACSPGMLQDADGLPITSDKVLGEYPVSVAWTGIVAHDADNPLGLTERIRQVIAILEADCSGAFEQELLGYLGAASLDEYLGNTNGFFGDHLRSYCKSRRYAPIYWPLSTPSGSYTLWLYYHRLTDQTLYTCVNDFVDPKLKQVSEEADRMRGKSHRSSAEEKELERLTDLELELKDFRDELLRVAKFWKPNLNDGVQITAAPLWKLFQHRQWRNRLKETWEKLEAGEYDWAHLALSIWPERVVRACQKDRSYAIAHDLEDQLWHEVEVGTDRQGNLKYEWQPRDLSEVELNEIIDEVKAR